MSFMPRPSSRDVIAGVGVALILIPQSIAYANLAGLPARHGLFAAALGPLAAGFFAPAVLTLGLAAAFGLAALLALAGFFAAAFFLAGFLALAAFFFGSGLGGVKVSPLARISSIRSTV